MSADPLTFEEVELAFVAKILALDASPYTLGATEARWSESTVPLTVIQDPSTLAHLAFSVWIQNALNTDLERDAEIDGYVYIQAVMKVAFTYRLRPNSQTRDARRATNAARDIIRALMAPFPASVGVAVVRLVDGLQTSISVDGEYLMISQDYTVDFDLDIAERRQTAPP